ncbi:acetyl-coenzyme A synthetase 2-like, mitochondrial isoform X2 [Hypanus sabinus]|uniref:acetyl-coenzyme A synthetase 2-like, mitochondrial isoform X2 n=1 Tax=Hypanus sabinus TaxID=79690 RepID=UPI0028C46772|nr:acetyl-coenzyme A synthetase 2-like, mitochondrial isoform X2 [Hypanus sabinus]
MWLVKRPLASLRVLLPGRLGSLLARCCSSDNISAFMPEAAAFAGVRDYPALREFSLQQTERFWGALARDRLSWISPFHTVSDCDLSRGKIRWFEGGRLNVSVNCIDRHVHTSPDKVALIWERDEPGAEVRVTYRQLLELTCRVANTLKRQGVRKGDRVTIYMPTSPVAVASMLACARIGAVHNVVFAGFSAEALAGRIQDAQSETVITTNQAVRGGKIIELKQTVDQAVKMCPSVKHVLVAKRTENEVPMSNIDIPLEEEMKKEEAMCDPVAMESEDMLFLLYTSGSTGKPKGIVHTQAGYLLYTSVTHRYVFDYRDGDVFGCVADIGWITGHSYAVYGPLCNGGTTVLFESTPVYPNPGRYWEMVERTKINQFYGAPTAIRLLLKYGDEWVKSHDRSSLKVLGSETGGICIAPHPAERDAEIVPAMAMRPFFGIDPVLMDEQGRRLTGNSISGSLCITQPWPGMARTIYNDHNRFVETYFKPYPNHFFTGDGAYRSAKGYYQITGRLDDVINISGHRLGTAEIEGAVNQHLIVAESAAIGCAHEIKGEASYVFIVLKDGVNMSEQVIREELRDVVSQKIAKYAAPDFIQIVKRLPKTRSGKIMRRVLRKIVECKLDELGDLTTLDDHTAVQEIVAGHREMLENTAKGKAGF